MRLTGMEREWIVADAVPPLASESLAAALGLPRIAAELLVRRGVSDPADATHFLDPRLKALRDPFQLPDMRAAVDRAWAAIDGGEAVMVHGDYDVDGMVGTAFLVRMLSALGARASYFLPDRLQDGYGLGAAGLREARERGATLIIAVDCGVTSNDLVDDARAAGIDTIILDHHQPPARLPQALAVVDAMRPDATYPFHGLCGVGVAAKFIQGMATARRRLDPALFVDALQLVALGTIADVVPLIDENRTFVIHGLKALARSEWPGIAALKRGARLFAGGVTATQVAFQLAPRLNAAGRMGCASLGVELLLADTPERGEFLAHEIERQNARRREADQLVSAAARAQVEGLGTLPSFLVLWSDDWPVGVIGIAAARVAEEFRRPTLLVGMNGDVGRGSARSFGGLDVGRAFTDVEHLLEAHGGHAQAAGLTVRRERLEELKQSLLELAADGGLSTHREPLTLDAELSPSDIDPDLVDFLNRMAPFGAGSPEPIFLVPDLDLVSAPRVVGGDHLRLDVVHGRRRMSAIGFGLARHARAVREGCGRVSLAATPASDDYKGGGAIQLRFRDVSV